MITVFSCRSKQERALTQWSHVLSCDSLIDSSFVLFQHSESGLVVPFGFCLDQCMDGFSRCFVIDFLDEIVAQGNKAKAGDRLR